MELIRLGPPGLPPYRVVLTTDPAVPEPRTPVRLRFAIAHPVTGAAVTDLAIVHEMPFHLFIVADDLTTYDHVHPALQADGTFAVEAILPRAGRYSLYCDFVPVGGTPQVVHLHLATAGVSQMPKRRARLAPDTTLAKIVDGIRFELALNPTRLAAGIPATLTYRLSDPVTGAPMTDLVPYLGAWGHSLILSEDGERYLHCHPTRAVDPAADPAGLEGGPDVAFDATIREPGLHRIWTQFKRGAGVTTVSFTVDVAAVASVLRWDGVAWSEPGAPGSRGPDGVVRALAARGGELFAGGDFLIAGGRGAAHVARWDGRVWGPMGTGVDGAVRAIAVLGADVYVGGEFASAGGVAAHGIARWDGARWWPLGDGIAGSSDPARPAAVYAIAARPGEIDVGGRFLSAGGIPSRGIARWDGKRWQPLGAGVAQGDSDGIVRSLAFFRGDLHVAGEFTDAGGVAVRNVARWSGGAFWPLGAGLSGGLERVLSLAAWSGRLYAGGEFDVSGDRTVGPLAAWDGASWRGAGLGASNAVRAVANAGGLIAGGGPFGLERGAGASRIARWDGRAWSAVGDGLAAEPLLAPVLAVARSGESVFVGGGPFVPR
jgi:hypothetical protein